MTERKQSPYDVGLEKNAANYVPLTPLTFIERSAYTYPNRVAVVHGKRRYTWLESYTRARRLASALKQLGVGKNDTVAAILNNTPEMFECHFGVPACGAVLNTINTRLDAEAVAFILNHGEAKVLITDREFSRMVGKAIELAGRSDMIVSTSMMPSTPALANASAPTSTRPSLPPAMPSSCSSRPATSGMRSR